MSKRRREEMRELDSQEVAGLGSAANVLAKHYEDLHWGIGASKVYDTRDPLIPDCAQMGRLLSVGLILPSGQEVRYEFPRGSHLGVEHGHPVDRLHLITPPSHRAEVEQHYRELEATYPQSSLGTLARNIGGRQAKYGYPNLPAVPLGEVVDIIYGTEKKGDTPSDYWHTFSEESHGPRPWLAADAEGRLWLVGGNYTVPSGGITD